MHVNRDSIWAPKSIRICVFQDHDVAPIRALSSAGLPRTPLVLHVAGLADRTCPLHQEYDSLEALVTPSDSRNSRIYRHSSRRGPGRDRWKLLHQQHRWLMQQSLAISTRRRKPPDRISTKSLRRSFSPAG